MAHRSERWWWPVCALLALGPACGSTPPPVEVCGNDLDDDRDGLPDCDDADCAADPSCTLPAEICDNELDDDGDGDEDCADAECAGEPACDATGEVCDNEADDDGDGDEDCADAECADEPGCAPPPAEICDNQLDDDGDGRQDCADGECAGLGACIQAAAPGDVVIVEIHADPAAVADGAGEWIELRNATDADLVISGWVLHDIDATAPEWHIIRGPSPVVLPAGGVLVLGALADAALNGGVPVDYAWGTFGLANDEDEVVLEAQGEQIDVVRYASPAWPLAEGRSLSLDPSAERADANDVPGAWCQGTVLYNAADRGTPGADNPACP